MYTVIGKRASSILYSWLTSNQIQREVIIPANICESVPATYLKAGCSISFCDIDHAFCLPWDVLLALAKEKENIIIHFNHAYGFLTEKQRLMLYRLKQEYPGIIIVEDCCLCIPELKYSSLCEDLDMVLFSTGNTKVADIGFGGYGYIHEKWSYKTAEEVFRQKDKDAFEVHVKESHIKENQKANMDIFFSHWLDCDSDCDLENYFALVQSQLQKVLLHKQKLNNIYAKIPGSLSNEYNTWRYNVFLENADYCKQVLFANGLYCSNHYMSLCNGYWSNDVTPYCNYVYKHILNLFNDFCYTEEQAIKTEEILSKIAVGISKEQLWRQ